MDHRQRVMAAVNLREPDRVPLALWGSDYSISDVVYFDLLKLLNIGTPLLPARSFKGNDYNYMDDRLLAELAIDTRYVDTGFTDLGGATRGGGKDCWGVKFLENTGNLTPVYPPLLNSTASDLADYPFPVSWKYMRIEEFKKRAKYLKEETDFAVVGRAIDTIGPFQRCCALRSREKFLSDLINDEEFSFTLVQKVSNVLFRSLEILLNEAGDYLDIIELPGDDYAGTRPFISPKMFDRIFAPTWQIMIDMIRNAAPRSRILFHSSGNIELFISRLCSMGVDIIHGISEQPGIDLSKFKDQFGGHVCFWGAIDPKSMLSGSEDQVTENVQRTIKTLGPGGGFVLSPSTHLDLNVPARNVIACFKTAKEFGPYPIK
jgi:uroporphyrinogen decarboxylase